MPQSYIGCFKALDKEAYPNATYRAIASCVSFFLRGNIEPEDIYEFIYKNLAGCDTKKAYNECLKHYGIRRRCKYKNAGSIHEVKKIIDGKIPIIYNDGSTITGYVEYGDSTKIKIDNSDTYIEFTKGSICW